MDPDSLSQLRPRGWPFARRWITRLAGGSQRGLTLIELLIVIAVIATLATIALLLYYNFSYQAQIARAVADIANISSEIQTFHMMNEQLPTSLAQINRSTFLDPWGRPYEYLDLTLGVGQPRKDGALHPINSDFDLYSKGRDGVSSAPLTASASRDDIIRANDGQFIGLASNY
jgi:general secretion pathway protein G